MRYASEQFLALLAMRLTKSDSKNPELAMDLLGGIGAEDMVYGVIDTLAKKK